MKILTIIKNLFSKPEQKPEIPTGTYKERLEFLEKQRIETEPK